MNIFQLLVIDPPKWLIKAIDKLRRGFLWCNDELATEGRCLVRWAAICRPLEYGDLGITDLDRKATALRVRWLWQAWVHPDKAWAGLPLNIDAHARTLFNAAVAFELGNGQTILFWKDPWLGDHALEMMLPELFKICTLRSATVAQALTDDKWMRHFKRGLTSAALHQFLLHGMVERTQLRPDMPDKVTWRWTENGAYSATSRI